MGAGNVGLVYARWGVLNHAPFRVLAYMALRSLDSGKPPVFYAGREEIAMAMGRSIPSPGPEFEKARKANWEAVKKVMGELTKAGAITLTTAAGPGQNAVYALDLTSPPQSYPQGDGGKPVPPIGGKPVPPESHSGGTQHPEWWEASSPPMSTRSTKDLRERPRTDGEDDQQPAGSARESLSENPESSSEEETTPNGRSIRVGDCTDCGTLLDPDGSCFVCRIPGTKKSPEYARHS